MSTAQAITNEVSRDFATWSVERWRLYLLVVRGLAIVKAVRLHPPPGQDALLLVDRHEVTVLLHPAPHSPNVVRIA
jgi:hypothetical protein